MNLQLLLGSCHDAGCFEKILHGLATVQNINTSYLVPEDLLFGHLVQPLNIGDDDGHDEVDHDDCPHDDHGHQQQHGEVSGQGRPGIVTTIPQIIKLKFSKDHDKAFHK